MAAHTPEPTWVRIAVTVSAEAAPGMTDVLLSLAHGVEEQPSAAGVRLTAYVPADSDVEGAVRRIRERLEALRSVGMEVGQGRITRRRIGSQAWEKAWKAGFGVVHVTPRLVVKPTWEEYAPAPGEVIVELDPGMAFGTGQHATTRGCLAALARTVRPGMTVFDIGAGSGILAIAAAKLGARRVAAVEIDEPAARIARQNAELNGVTDIVLVVCGEGLRPIASVAQPPSAVSPPRPARGGASPLVVGADVIVANLTADQIARMAPDVAAHLRADGVFVASGIALEQEVGVCEAVAPAGFALRESEREEEWVTMIWELMRDAPIAG